MKKTTQKEAIKLKCRDCNYDELSVGTFLEQTAACANANCDLHQHRPVPRSCRKGGKDDPVAVKAVRDKIESGIRRKADR